MKMGRAVRNALTLVSTLGLLLPGASAVAEVSLQTVVNKVETTLDEDGRVRRELLPADAVLPGEELRYGITFTNNGETVVEAERIVITNPIPDGTEYLPGSAGGDWTLVEYSSDGETFDTVDAAAPAENGAPADAVAPADAAGDAATAPAGAGMVSSLRWTYRRDLPPGGSGQVFFHVRMR